MATAADPNKAAADANNAGADPNKADLQTKLEELRAKRAALGQKLDDVKNATEANWDEAKTAFHNAYEEVRTIPRRGLAHPDGQLSFPDNCGRQVNGGRDLNKISASADFIPDPVSCACGTGWPGQCREFPQPPTGF